MVFATAIAPAMPDSLSEMYRRSRDQGFGAEVKRRIMLGTYALSAGYYDAYYLKAQKVRTLLARDFEAAFKKVDAIVTPTSPTAAFKLGEKVDDPLAMYLADIFTVTANLTGICGISIPCGETKEKLPIGLQILGKHFDEATILRVSSMPRGIVLDQVGALLRRLVVLFVRRKLRHNTFPSRRTSRRKLIPSPQISQTIRSPLYPGNSSGGRSTFTHCVVNRSSSEHFAISQHLLAIFVFNLGMHLPRQRLGRLFGRDAHGFAGAYVDEGGCHFAPVAELQGALAETAAGNHGDGIGGAAVDFHKSNQAFAVLAARIVDAELCQAEHGQAHAENLAGAQVSVGLFGVAQIFVERFHLKTVVSQPLTQQSNPRRNRMKCNSRPKAALVVLLAISLLATGCSAQWISVALADLPVLLQMALNIGSLVTTLQSGKQLSASEAPAIQNISAEASKDLNLAANALQPVQGESDRQRATEDPKRDCGHQSEICLRLLQAAHIGDPVLVGANHGGGESDSDNGDQLCCVDSADVRDADRSQSRGVREEGCNSPAAGS